MLQTQQIEQLINLVAAFDRARLIEEFQSYKSDFPLDFTVEFLESQPLDRLRHLFVALCLHTQRLPDIPANAA